MNINPAPTSTIEKEFLPCVSVPTAARLSMKGSLPSNAANNHMPERGGTETSTVPIASNSLQHRRCEIGGLPASATRRSIAGRCAMSYLAPLSSRKDKMAAWVLKTRFTVT
jgi:hypothetical protein